VQAGGVEIKKGALQVTLGYFGGDMGHITYTLRYQNGRFGLIGFDSIDVDRSGGTIDQVSINFATRRLKHSAGSISSDADKVTWRTLAARPLLTMQQIGDGLDFKPPAK
jgi:hypothetical protein